MQVISITITPQIKEFLQFLQDKYCTLSEEEILRLILAEKIYEIRSNQEYQSFLKNKPTSFLANNLANQKPVNSSQSKDQISAEIPKLLKQLNELNQKHHRDSDPINIPVSGSQNKSSNLELEIRKDK